MKKIKLSFMNGGKPFELPSMSVNMQEKMLEYMVELDKQKLPSTLYNNKVNKYIVYIALDKIDSAITEEMIGEMHPDDFIFVYTNIWNQGRELTEGDKNFPKTKV